MAEPVPHARGRVRVVIVVALAVLLVAELCVRLFAGSLTKPLTWADWEVQNKVTRMDELAARGGTSVALVGSSMMNADANPATLTASLRADRPVFNAAINGADARFLEAWTLGVVVPRLHPSTVVIGVSTRELNDLGRKRNDRFNGFVRSPSGAAVTHRETGWQQAERWAERYSYVFRYRAALRQPWALANNRIADRAARVLPDGTIATLPAVLSRVYRVTDDYRRSMLTDVYDKFAVGGLETDALRRLVRGLRDQHINVLLVDMPVSGDAVGFHPHGAADYAQFGSLLSGFAATEQVQVLDERAAFPTTAEFADPFHLNAAGRRHFTTDLGQRLLHQVSSG